MTPKNITRSSIDLIFKKGTFLWKRKKEGDLTQPIVNTKTPTKNFDYTTIADRLRAVSWSSNSYPTDLVKPGLTGTNLSTHHNSSVIKRKHDTLGIRFTIQIDFCQDGYILNVI